MFFFVTYYINILRIFKNYDITIVLCAKFTKISLTLYIFIISRFNTFSTFSKYVVFKLKQHFSCMFCSLEIFLLNILLLL